MTQITQNDAGKSDPQTYAIIGAAMEVHRELGPGFLEAVYQEAMEFELADRQIVNRPQVELAIRFKQRTLKTKYKPDFICFGDVIVEIKALKALTDIERAQVINYLKATGIHRALLINFGAKQLEFERFVFGPPNSRSTTSPPSV
jgi:GxxExxY protein